MKLRTLLACALPLLSAADARPDTTTLDAVADTALFSLYADHNYGGVPSLPVGGIDEPGQEGRALLRFDLASALPPGGVVTAVKLRVKVVKESGDGRRGVFELHRMLASWAEGAGNDGNHGSVAEAGESSWNSRLSGAGDWGQPGGAAGSDFLAEPSASLSLGHPGTYTFSSTGLLDDVKAWLANPAANNGWMIKGAVPLVAGSGKRLGSRESGGSVAQLILDFNPPAPGPAFSSFKLAEGQFELRFHGEPGNIYEIQFQDVLGAATWMPLTNFPVKFLPIDASVLEPVDQPVRCYRLAITGQID